MIRRPSRRVALCVLAGLALLGVPAGAAAPAGAGLASYTLKANAPGLAVEGLYRDVALTVPEVTSSLTTGNVGAGLATLAWPGALFGNAGSTILVLRPDAPPETAMLNSPVRAEARTGGPRKAANTSVPGTVMASTAEPDEVTAEAAFTDLVLPLGTAGGNSSSSRVVLSGLTTAVAEARNEVQDLVLADGAITIGSVVSTAEARTDGSAAFVRGGTTVTDMEVAGVPVTVDGTGLKVAGNAAPLPLEQKALDSALATLGLQAVLTAPRSSTGPGTSRYDAGALVLLYESDGAQYALTLGRASASVTAGRAVVAPAGAPSTVVQGAPPAAAPAPPVPTLPDPVAEPAPAAPAVADPPLAPLPAEPVLAAPVSAPGVGSFVPLAFALAGGVPLVLLLLGAAVAATGASGLLRLPARVLVPATAAPCPLLAESRRRTRS